MHAAPNAFTLIELLVVVTVIAVLLALLTPVLDKAISAAGNARCLTNARQWSQAMYYYSYDHRKATIVVTELRGNYWHWRLAPYLGQPTYGKTTLGAGVYEILEVNTCPEAGPSPPGLGSARTMWAYDVSQGAYGLNLWMSSNFRPGTYPDEPGKGFTRYIGSPGTTPFLADSQWVGSWPDHNDAPSTNTDQPLNNHERGFFMNRFAIARHNLGRKSVNVAFVGGHAETVRLGDLWKLPWHRQYERNDSHEDCFD